MSSVTKDSFTSSFQCWITVICFSCLIALVRNSRTMLNESDESGHLCFILDIGGQACSVPFKHDVCDRFCIDVLYQVEEVPWYF